VNLRQPGTQRVKVSYDTLVARRKPRPALRRSQRLAARVMKEHARLRVELADMDPQHLLHILISLLQPIGSGRRFFMRSEGNRHVF